MLKIAVIGGRETVQCFKALGLEAYPADKAEDAVKILRRLTRERDDVAIIYVEETLATGMSQEIDRFKDSPTPAIILIPGREGSQGMGLNALRTAVERAVGTNILGD